MIKPTIGKVVWFWPLGSNPSREDSQPCAALVTYVHDDYLVNLVVFDRNGDGRSYTNVRLFQAHEGEGRPNEPHCEWMPYQKGQAAKNEYNIPGLEYDIPGLVSRLTALEGELAGMRNFIAAIAKDISNREAAKTPGQAVPPASNAVIPPPPLKTSNSTGENPVKDGTGVA